MRTVFTKNIFFYKNIAVSGYKKTPKQSLGGGITAQVL